MNKLIQNNPENWFTGCSANQGQSIWNDSLCNNESKKMYNFFILLYIITLKIYSNIGNFLNKNEKKNELINIWLPDWILSIESYYI